MLIFRAMFTQTNRYSYVDPDYAYTDYEAGEIKAHRDKYIKYIQVRLFKNFYNQFVKFTGQNCFKIEFFFIS